MNRNIKRKSNTTPKEKISLFPVADFLKEQRTQIILGIALALFSLYLLFAMTGFFFQEA